MKKKPFTLIELIASLVISIIIVSIFIIVVGGGIMIYFGYQAGKEVQENGMKPTVERIWIGPEQEENQNEN